MSKHELNLQQLQNMHKLKPCPFCGGEAELIRLGGFYASCAYCNVSRLEDGIWGYVTEEEAVNEWNTRHERTCKMEIESSKEQSRYVSNWYVCSECKNPMNPGANYCSNCGAKVVN